MVFNVKKEESGKHIKKKKWVYASLPLGVERGRFRNGLDGVAVLSRLAQFEHLGCGVHCFVRLRSQVLVVVLHVLCTHTHVGERERQVWWKTEFKE